MNKKNMSYKQLKKIIEKSSLFNTSYYLRHNSDARLANETPINHFCKIGIKEDRKSNISFDPIWYKEYYQDVKKDGVLPLIHYILYGKNENRFINSLEKDKYNELIKNHFDVKSYKDKCENFNDNTDFILHYIRYGRNIDDKKKTTYIKKHSHIFKHNFENVNTSGISGWVYDLQNNNRNDVVKLQFIIDNNKVIEATSSLDRGDIKKAFNIQCQAGYKVNIPLEYLDGQKYNLKVIAIKDSKYYLLKELTFSEKYIDTKQKNIAVLEKKTTYIKKHSHIFKHNFENVNTSGISGWVYDLQNNNRNDVVKLQFIIDNNKVIEATSSLDRGDIKKAFNIQCQAGYKVNIPLEYLDGQKYNLKVIAIKDSKYYLLKELTFSEKSQWLYSKKDTEKVILLCTHNLRSQGAQNSLFELAIGLRRLYGITPIIYSPSDGPLKEKYKSHNIKVIVDNSFNVSCKDIQSWKKEIQILELKLKQLECNIVIANTLITFYMIHAAYNIQVPTIFIPRESEPPKSYFNYLSSDVRKEAYSTMIKASQLVFVADATRKPWSFLDIDNSFKVIHNSLNTSLLNQDSIYSRSEIRNRFNINEEDIVLLSLGTVTPRKGQLDFVKSLEDVFLKSKKNIKVFIVGIDTDKGEDTEPYSKEIYNLIKKFSEDIKRNIFLIPETDKQSFTKPYEFYAMADIYIFTSRIESFPRVMLEALYFSLPVITTPCFGVVEQCVENYNAFYYQEEDITQLTEHILTLIGDNKKRNSFASASKELFTQLQTYDQMIKNYYSIIERIEKGN